MALLGKAHAAGGCVSWQGAILLRLHSTRCKPFKHSAAIVRSNSSPRQVSTECPLIDYTDLDMSLCKAIEESQLARPESSSRALGSSIGRHPPHGMHDLEGPEHQLDDLERAVLLPPVLGHGGDPTPRRVVDTGIGHQQMLSVLDPQRLIIDHDRDGLPPQDPIHIQPEVVQSNLTMLAYLAPELAKSEDAPETARFDAAPPGISQDDFRRHVVKPPLGVLAFVRPMAPDWIAKSVATRRGRKPTSSNSMIRQRACSSVGYSR
jgi:hypothetical protein